jgi:hypothetical protein
MIMQPSQGGVRSDRLKQIIHIYIYIYYIMDKLYLLEGILEGMIVFS